jgi:hypothetical protein
VSFVRLGALLLTLATTLTASLPAQPVPGFSNRFLSPDAVFHAFEAAYPDLADVPNPLEGPAIVVGGTSFSWAEGRLLPFENRKQWTDYAPQSFYEYPKETPDVASWTAEELSRAEARLADRVATNLKRDPGFFDALWGIHNRGTADAAQRKIQFLGLPVSVHRLLIEPLARVQGRLEVARVADPSLDAFLKTLVRLEGYNWRDIAGTQSRSNHAYGTALDIVPRTYGSKNPYWLWVAQDGDGWYRQAWKQRWQPHPALVKAFEDEGFVWGGKWLLFDTIHFEYRPEILILNGLR